MANFNVKPQPAFSFVFLIAEPSPFPALFQAAGNGSAFVCPSPSISGSTAPNGRALQKKRCGSGAISA
ncbi:MAG: hypothetical protein DBY36_04330 [Clostridiales bacterium]|nr:MAG: hypothetical protein DBY36_04330 [Clostridiales bacterium]